MRIQTISLVLTLTAAALFACGGSQPAANPPPAATDAADSGAASPKETTTDAGAGVTTATPAASSSAATPAPSGGSAFDSLSKDKKVEVMATKVVPNVGKLFKEHNTAKFGKFGCATCHGPQKKDDPHAVLPKLTLSNGGFEKLSKSKPEMMKFMSEKVVPAMAAALGEKPFDPATKQGFGCAGCHAVD